MKKPPLYKITETGGYTHAVPLLFMEKPCSHRCICLRFKTLPL